MKKRLLLLIISLFFLCSVLPATVRAQTPGPDVGAFLPLADAQNPDPWTFRQFQDNAQHHLDIFLWYQDIGDTLDVVNLQGAAENGSKIQLAWLPWDPYVEDPVNNPDYKLTNITNGTFDADIHRWANDIKNFPHQILFRPMGEMNGNWLPWACGNAVAGVAPVNGNSPADYVPAYRRVHDIFEADGVTNVEWVWAPNRDGPPNENTPGTAVAQYTFDTYYPGDDYVDYIGIDGYNWGNEYWWSSWQDLGEVFGYSYDVFRNSTMNSNPKPKLMIAEMSSTENGAPTGKSKASWITDAYNSWLLYRFPDVENVTWFSEAGDVDFRITSSTESQSAFHTAMQSLYDRSYFTNFFFDDNNYADSWVLGANPASVNDSNGILPRLEVGSTSVGFPAVDADRVQNSSPTQSGGPAKLTTPQLTDNPLTHTSTKVVGGQRTLWHGFGGFSFEEVPARYFADLSDHYYWPWYDSAGFNGDWLSIPNPNPFPLYFEAKNAGETPLLASGIVQPNQPVFPGLTNSGGPLEIQFWVADPADNPSPSVQKRLAPAKSIPSQRLLYNNSKDFTEIPGTPAEELSDRYLWPWYDESSGYFQDWVVIANPNNAPVDYTVKIHEITRATGTLQAAGQPGDIAAPRFPGTMGGPVEVIATYQTGGQPAKVIASQRTLRYPGYPLGGFEEVGGLPASQDNGVSHLRASYFWPYYDQQSAGAADWLLLANPGPSQVTYTVKIAGVPKACPQVGCVLAPYGFPNSVVNFTYPGTASGPVEVTASGNILASQRVLWNYNFNEVMGAITD